MSSFNEWHVCIFQWPFVILLLCCYFKMKRFCLGEEVKDILLIVSHKISECDELSVLINFMGYFSRELNGLQRM